MSLFSSTEFVHLRLHSEYSIVDGIVRIKELIKKFQSQKVSMAALTDQTNLFGAVKIL